MSEVRAKILQISDLHFGEGIDENLKERVSQIVVEISPDILIVSGDLAHHPFPWLLKRAAQFLEELRSKCPTKRPEMVVIPGNHDYKFWGNLGLRRLTRIPFHVYFRRDGLSKRRWQTR